MKGDGNTAVDAILHLIQQGSVGAEIGVWKGNSSFKFLSKSPKMLYLVDPYSLEGYSIPIANKDKTFNYDKWLLKYGRMIGGSDPEDFESYYNNVYKSVVERFEGHNNVTICRMTSDKWLTQTSPETLDWIYIDADHSYSGVLNDLTKSLRVVKKEGLLLGDDYNSRPGVVQAVNEFVDKYQLNVEFYGIGQYCIRK